MAKLSDSFERDNFELLRPICSPDTMRSRRGLTVTSFAIIAITVLERPLSELNVFGLSLADANLRSALYLLLLMLSFWLLAYALNELRDSRINAERRHLIEKETNALQKELIRLTRKIDQFKQQGPDIPGHYVTDKRKVEGYLQVVSKQSNRTKLARAFGAASRAIELAVPIVGGLAAIYIVTDSLCLIPSFGL